MVKKALRKRLHRTYRSLTRLKIFTNLATNVNKKSRENRIFMTKVLILDHSKSMRKTLGERLAYEGYAIEATDDVSEASEMCRQMAFDVVLTDDSSNASPLGIPFIVLAGAGDNQIQRAVTAFRDGAMDFLQIPYFPTGPFLFWTDAAPQTTHVRTCDGARPAHARLVRAAHHRLIERHRQRAAGRRTDRSLRYPYPHHR